MRYSKDNFHILQIKVAANEFFFSNEIERATTRIDLHTNIVNPKLISNS